MKPDWSLKSKKSTVRVLRTRERVRKRLSSEVQSIVASINPKTTCTRKNILKKNET